MDKISTCDTELVQIIRDINAAQILFHPLISPYGEINQKQLKHSSKPIIISIDTNILIDLVHLCSGQKLSPDRIRIIALLMLWIECIGASCSCGQALQEISYRQGAEQIKKYKYIYDMAWERYTPNDWLILYRGLEQKLPSVINERQSEEDVTIYLDTSDGFLQAYASVLHMVILLRNQSLSAFEKTCQFVEWTYANTIAAKYVIAYAALLFSQAEEGISAPKKANSKNLEAVICGCKNQAWDLAHLSNWSRILHMEKTGDVEQNEVFIATQDEDLKKVIMAAVESDDMRMFLRKYFTHAKTDELLQLMTKLKQRTIRADIQDLNYLSRLVESEKDTLISTFEI